MKNVSMKDLIDLINEAGEQDEAAETAISMDNLDASFVDLGVDSLTFLSVVAQLEGRYGIRVRFEDAARAKSPTELFEIVNSRLETA